MYSQEVADAICARLANGESLRSICRKKGMPAASTVISWLAMPERAEFAEQYARAREIGYRLLADEIVSISDETSIDARHEGKKVTLGLDAAAVARNRLRVDTRKWLLSKMLPKVYGDRLDVDVKGNMTVKLDNSDDGVL